MAAQSVTIMSFNAENLFDASDDLENPGENLYLPLALKQKRGRLHDIACDAYYGGYPDFLKQCKTLDWNEQVYARKLQRLAEVIGAVMPRPDVIVLQEVENRQVLEDLVSRHLTGDGYLVIQLDTSEKLHNRGIDVGILSRLDLAAAPTAYRVDFGDDGERCGFAVRDILAAPLKLPDGETLYVFGVHFSPGAQRLPCRLHAFRKLNNLASALPLGSLAVAAGDFNFNCVDAVSDAVVELLREGAWYASPLFTHGCSLAGSFRDYAVQINKAGQWSFLDMILVSPTLNPAMPTSRNWFADLGSFSTVVVHPEQVGVDAENRGYVFPQWFQPTTGHGVSDHFPVTIRLMPRRN
jgi:endonuclease/exonuclease/phosphatase family metal-dependent hydrolase